MRVRGSVYSHPHELTACSLKCSLKDENGSLNTVKRITYNQLDYSPALSHTDGDSSVILVLGEVLEETFEWKALTQEAKSARLF